MSSRREQADVTMHSALNRLQNVFGFFTSVAFAVALLIAVSPYVGFPSGNGFDKTAAKVDVRNLQL